MTKKQDASAEIVAECKKRWMIEGDKEKLNLAHFSEDTGINITSVWFYFNSDRRWPADSWIKTLVYFGYATISPDSCTIKIDLPVNSEIRKALKKLASPKWK